MGSPFTKPGVAGSVTVVLCPNGNQTGNNANCVQSPVMNFGSQGTSTAGPALTMTVNNCQNPLTGLFTALNIPAPNSHCTGSGSLTLGTPYFTITGTNAADWSNTATGTCANGTVLAAGASCTVILKFTPTASAGTAETASLNISDNGTTSTQTLSLNGTSVTKTDLSACGTLSTTNAFYQLTADLSASGSCLLIAANGVSINLNGHTITYQTGGSGSTGCVFGVYAAPSFDSFWNTGQCANGNATSSTANAFSVFNGTITQGSCLGGPDNFAGTSSGEFMGSDPILVGQFNASNASNVSIFNLQFNTCAGSTQSIYSRQISNGWTIHDTNTTSKVVEVQSRSNYQHMGIALCNNCQNAGNTTGATIYNNSISGGAGGGIEFGILTSANNNNALVGNPGGVPTGVSGGTTNCDSSGANPYTNAAGTAPSVFGSGVGNQCTNDFSIFSVYKNNTYSNNFILPAEGRCIFLGDPGANGSTGQTEASNYCNFAVEFPNNAEYHNGTPMSGSSAGCEAGGAHGLEFRDAVTGATFGPNNIIIVKSNKWCGADALRTRALNDPNDVVKNNWFIALVDPAAGVTCAPLTDLAGSNCAYAYSSLITGLSQTTAFNMTTKQNIFQGDSGLIFLDSGQDTGTWNPTLSNDTWVKPSTADSSFHFLTMPFCGGCGSGTWNGVILDPVYSCTGGGCTKASFFDTNVGQSGANFGTLSFQEQFTETVQCNKNSGPACNGATVTFTDSHANAYTCTTNSSGLCSVAVTDKRDFNTGSANGHDNGYNPQSLAVSLAGCTTNTQTGITISATNSNVISSFVWNVVLAGC